MPPAAPVALVIRAQDQQARVAQDAEVLADAVRFHPQLLRQLGDAMALAIGAHLDDGPAVRTGEGGEDEKRIKLRRNRSRGRGGRSVVHAGNGVWPRLKTEARVEPQQPNRQKSPDSRAQSVINDPPRANSRDSSVVITLPSLNSRASSVIIDPSSPDGRCFSVINGVLRLNGRAASVINAPVSSLNLMPIPGVRSAGATEPAAFPFDRAGRQT